MLHARLLRDIEGEQLLEGGLEKPFDLHLATLCVRQPGEIDHALQVAETTPASDGAKPGRTPSPPGRKSGKKIPGLVLYFALSLAATALAAIEHQWRIHPGP